MLLGILLLSSIKKWFRLAGSGYPRNVVLISGSSHGTKVLSSPYLKKNEQCCQFQKPKEKMTNEKTLL